MKVFSKILTNSLIYVIIKYVIAGMAELADAPDLESGVSRREGSSPFTRTSMDVFIECYYSIKTFFASY